MFSPFTFSVVNGIVELRFIFILYFYLSFIFVAVVLLLFLYSFQFSLGFTKIYISPFQFLYYLVLKNKVLFFFFKESILLFIFGCVGSSLLHVGFLQLWRAGATLHCSVRASHCGGLSCCGAQALGAWASVVVAHRLSGCGTWAQLLHGMWDLPRPGIEPVSPALAGGFLTTAPPGKSPSTTF